MYYLARLVSQDLYRTVVASKNAIDMCMIR